jgi:hypothetical protein
MQRLLALCLGAAVLAGGCAFGHAEPEAPGDPYAHLPRLLTLEAEIHGMVARNNDLSHQLGELGKIALVEGGEWSADHAELMDVYRAWAEAAVTDVATIVRNAQLGDVAPELRAYSDALDDWTHALADGWRAALTSEAPIPPSGDELAAVDRLLAARGAALLDALPAGQPGGNPSHDYIVAFTGQAYGPDWAELGLDGPDVFDDPDLWQQRVDALAAARTAWTDVSPPDVWSDFHDRWSGWFKQHLDLARLYQPGGFVTEWDAWTYLTLRADRAATRARLEAEWLTTVAAAVDAAHTPAPA